MLPAAAAAFLSACCTAAMMPRDEYVAPLTVSTPVDCVATIVLGIDGHASEKYANVSDCSTRSMEAIFPPLTVTLTRIVSLKPSPSPVYTPSA